jgi:hypothetical protein
MIVAKISVNIFRHCRRPTDEAIPGRYNSKRVCDVSKAGLPNPEPVKIGLTVKSYVCPEFVEIGDIAFALKFRW